MPTNEAEVPQRVYVQILHRAVCLFDHDPREVHDNGKPVYEYVPAGALSDAWDTAIKTLIRAADECPVFVYHSARGRDFLIEALEAARDAALSVGKCATSEEVGHDSV